MPATNTPGGLAAYLKRRAVFATIAASKGGGGRSEAYSPLKTWGQVSTGGTTNDKSCHASHRRSAPWTRVRAHVAAAGVINGLAAAVAVSANDASQYVPSGSNTFVPFVFPSTTIAAPTVPGSPPGAASVVPNTLVSDWVSLPSIARNDGGAGYLCHVRGYQDATSANNLCFVSISSDITDVDEIGSWYGLSATTGNQNTNKAQTFGLTNVAFPIFLEFENVAGARVQSVGRIGDSTAQGWSVGNRRINATQSRVIRAMQAEGVLVDEVDLAWAGSTTAGGTGTPPASVLGYWGQFLALTQNLQSLPSVLSFMPTSPNNALFTSAGGITDTRYWADYFCDWCAARGIKPILVTPFPRGTSAVPALSAGAETNRRLCCAEIVASAAAKGAWLVDQSALLTDLNNAQGGFTDPAWAAEVGAAALHLSLAGSDVIYSAWNTATRAALAA